MINPVYRSEEGWKRNSVVYALTAVVELSRKEHGGIVPRPPASTASVRGLCAIRGAGGSAVEARFLRGAKGCAGGVCILGHGAHSIVHEESTSAQRVHRVKFTGR